LFPHNPDGTRGDGESFIAALAALVAQRQIPVHVEHRVAGVIVDEAGRVVGVRVITPDGEDHREAARRSSFARRLHSQREMRRYYMGGRVFRRMCGVEQ